MKKKLPKILIAISIVIVLVILCIIIYFVGTFEFIPPSMQKLLLFEKPVIYLYPEKPTNIKVRLFPENIIGTTYPEYGKGWDVVANSDGEILNNFDSKQYSYLFWEGRCTDMKFDLNTGFVIEGKDTSTFLQNKLTEIGLTPKEYNEFIVFWLPQMKNNKYNLIHFATKEEYANKVILDVDPKPDSVLRVFMVFKKIENKIEIKPQDIQSFLRKGFSLIEWGGSEIQ
jgi:uncharacterized protein YdhG (YjbR/CyaY superfamily)